MYVFIHSVVGEVTYVLNQVIIMQNFWIFCFFRKNVNRTLLIPTCCKEGCLREYI